MPTDVVDFPESSLLLKSYASSTVVYYSLEPVWRMEREVTGATKLRVPDGEEEIEVRSQTVKRIHSSTV